MGLPVDTSITASMVKCFILRFQYNTRYVLLRINLDKKTKRIMQLPRDNDILFEIGRLLEPQKPFLR